jgi:hypothetical protein
MLFFLIDFCVYFCSPFLRIDFFQQTGRVRDSSGNLFLPGFGEKNWERIARPWGNAQNN